MQGVRVSLSSGDVFYVADVTPKEVGDRFAGLDACYFDDRVVYMRQVAQIVAERDIPSIHTPERLEDR